MAILNENYVELPKLKLILSDVVIGVTHLHKIELWDPIGDNLYGPFKFTTKFDSNGNIIVDSFLDNVESLLDTLGYRIDELREALNKNELCILRRDKI